MTETPEDVYRAAAEANVRTLLANDRTSWTPEQLDETARLHAQMPSFRAGVDAAYAAGREDAAQAILEFNRWSADREDPYGLIDQAAEIARGGR